jgi:putative spermidine/putrescine transport system permease protein
MSVFFLYPLLGIVLRSFEAHGRLIFATETLSFGNYVATITNPLYRLIARNTFMITIQATAVTVVAAYPVAYLISRLPARRSIGLLLLASLPFWTSILVRLYALSELLNAAGLLFTRLGTIIGMVYYLLPYMVAILYASMVAIDSELVRAARTLGASGARAMWHVVVPLSRSGLVAGALLLFILGLGFYLTPAILGGPGDVTIAVYIQQQVNALEWGIASAMGCLLLMIALVVFGVFQRVFGVERLVTSGMSPQKGALSAGLDRLRPARVCLWIYTMVVFLFLLGPLLVVVMSSFSATPYLVWPPKGPSLRWYREVIETRMWWDSAWLSLRIAVGTSVSATILGLSAAIALERLPIPGRSMLRALFIGPLIVPTILVAIAMFDQQIRLRIAGTVGGYIIAHTILALPFSVILLSNSLRSAAPELEEVARTLGASRYQAFWHVTMKRITPSVATAAAFAFLASWDEVVVSLFLGTEIRTLPVNIFTYLIREVRPTIAAISTLLLAAVLAFGVLFHIWGSRRERRSTQVSQVT